MTLRRAFTAAAIVLTIGLSSGDAAPQPSGSRGTAACLADFTATQDHRQAGDIDQALDAARRCAATVCPEVIRRKCGVWAEELEALRAQTPPPENADEIPEVPPDPATETLEPPPTPSPDPEPTAAAPPRPRDAPSPPPDAPMPDRQETHVPHEAPVKTTTPAWLVVSYVGVGVGALAMVAGGILGGVVLDDKRRIADRCATTGCTQEAIDRLGAMAHTTTGLLAAGGGVLGLSLLGVLLGHLPADDETTARFHAEGLTLAF